MITTGELTAIEARATATTGVSWSLDGPAHRITVRSAEGACYELRVTREREPAAMHDLVFIAHAQADVARLIAHLRGQLSVSQRELGVMEKRAAQASPGPWRAFLESDGGIGGSSVIWVSEADNEPDLYLWLGSDPASDADFEFVAAVRQDLPRLLAEARRQSST